MDHQVSYLCNLRCRAIRLYRKRLSPPVQLRAHSCPPHEFYIPIGRRQNWALGVCDLPPNNHLHPTDKRFSFAELAIGIIVGCLPTLPRFFKQFVSKTAASSPNKSRAPRRKLFTKSATPDLNNNDTSDFNLNGRNSPGSNGALHYETLTQTRNSLQSAESTLPRVPSPVYDTGFLTRPLQITPFHAEAKEYKKHGADADIERANPGMESMRNAWDVRDGSSIAATKPSTFRSTLEYAC